MQQVLHAISCASAWTHEGVGDLVHSGSIEAMNKKRKFDGVRAQAPHGGHWDRGSYRNSEHQNSTRFDGGRVGRVGGRYGQNGGGGS